MVSRKRIPRRAVSAAEMGDGHDPKGAAVGMWPRNLAIRYATKPPLGGGPVTPSCDQGTVIVIVKVSSGSTCSHGRRYTSRSCVSPAAIAVNVKVKDPPAP